MKELSLIVTFCYLLLNYPNFSIGQRDDPDLNRTTIDLINSRGFKSESHSVQTEDGYILTVHRIINPYCTNTKPVILQHGILASSADFLINSAGEDLEPSLYFESNSLEIEYPNTSVGNNLGFVLSKRCYDVWMPNSRGNIYSLHHVNLTFHDKKFWEFSFDEMIMYDLPAVIHYILNATNSSKK